jgi:hypothetical protein
MKKSKKWNDQINKICRNLFFTLKRLWQMARFTPIETRKKLVTSHCPQFLYCDVINLKKTRFGHHIDFWLHFILLKIKEAKLIIAFFINSLFNTRSIGLNFFFKIPPLKRKAVFSISRYTIFQRY